MNVSSPLLVFLDLVVGWHSVVNASFSSFYTISIIAIQLRYCFLLKLAVVLEVFNLSCSIYSFKQRA